MSHRASYEDGKAWGGEDTELRFVQGRGPVGGTFKTLDIAVVVLERKLKSIAWTVRSLNS